MRNFRIRQLEEFTLNNLYNLQTEKSPLRKSEQLYIEEKLYKNTQLSTRQLM